MFFRVEAYDGRAEVYGLRPSGPGAEVIEPRRIFRTRWLGYDNIHRNVLVTALDRRVAPDFCAYLKRRFPEYSDFIVAQAGIVDVAKRPHETIRQKAYSCVP